MNKLKLIGVRNIPLGEDEVIGSNTDYLISLRAQREGIYQPDSQGDETEPMTYTLKVSNYEQIQKIGESKQVEFQKGYSPSQIQRFALQEFLKTTGRDEEYEDIMKLLVDYINDTDRFDRFLDKAKEKYKG